MSFKLYISNRLDELQKELSKNLKSQTVGVFHKDVLVTQTEGMNRWLSIELAESLDIFANAEFFKPNGFISSIFKLAEVVDNQDFSTEKLRWVIYQLLENEAFVEKFERVAQYYEGDEIKRLQLATRVSDLFDQYLIYRPDYIQAWNKGEHAEINREKYKYHEEWQGWLWQKLQDKVDFEDKVELRTRLVEQMKNPLFIERLQKRFPKISLFGLSVLTPFHLEIFSWLSNYITIDFYQLNPSPENYWYDQTSDKSISKIEKFTKKSANELLLQSGNTLLSNWGKIGKDAFASLFAHDEVLDIMDGTASIAPLKDTLLGKIQSNIFDNTKAQTIVLGDTGDGSLQISSCYTPVREVEVFYNYVLDLMEKDKSVEPKDILVLVNDIDLYAPFIKAIFDNAPLKIPYSIADRSFIGGDTISSVLDLVLKISPDEFTSENVLQLLDFEIVKTKFGITDIDLIRRVMNDANIRYGIAGDKEYETNLVSWKNGLERILLGYAIKGGAEYETKKGKTYPLDTIEGSDVTELLRFKAFVDAVILLISQRREARTLGNWRLYVEDYIFNNLIETNETVMEEYHIISEHLALLEEVSPILEEVNYDVFQKAFLDSLVNNVHAGNFITGRVTFCSMIPMRSIPFKTIALLGMNSDAFPRKDSKLGFNLLEDDKRRGDREVKESDKYLFLESMLSAKDYFYLSYIGRNTKDNSSLSPSLLIDELLDYIEQACEESVKEFVVQHPLHGFNANYFNGNTKLFTYFGDKSIRAIEEEKIKSAIAFDFTTIQLSQLISFYKDPIKWYFNKVLGIYENNNQQLLDEHEKFDLDNLEQYSLRKNLFTVTDLDGFRKEAVAKGVLPLKNMADVKLTKFNEEIKSLKELYLHFTEGIIASELVEVDLKIGEVVLSSQVKNIYGDNHVVVSYSKQSSIAKYVLEAWFEFLLLRANDTGLNVVFLIREREEPLVFAKEMVSQKEATEMLEQLVSYFIEGHQNPLPFLPNWSYKTYLDETKFLKNLKGELKYNEFATILANERCFEEGTLNKELFDSLSALVYGEIATVL